MSLDASYDEEVLVCGDLRGDIVLFPLLKSILLGTSSLAIENASFVTYFKGAHEFEDDPDLYVLKPIKCRYRNLTEYAKQVEKEAFKEAEKVRKAREDESNHHISLTSVYVTLPLFFTEIQFPPLC